MLYLLFSTLLACIYASGVEQIALNYDHLSTDIVITFAAYDTSDTSAIVLYGNDANNLTLSVEAKGSTYTLGSYTSPMLYKATIENLEAGNHVYYYSVGSDGLGYSEVMSFKSHPGVGVDDVTFYLIGDLGQTYHSEDTLDELSQCESLLKTPSGGIISMGDLSYANGDEPLWDSFGRMKQSTASRIPMMTTLGNHEWFDDQRYAFTAYLARYDNPLVNGERELYYSFDSGLVHWVMVAGYCSEMKSTHTQPCLEEGSPQMDWLQKDLASVDRTITPWVFVTFHQPYVNSNTAHSMSSEGYPMQEAIEDTLNEYKVDAVFSGHVHAYERSYPVYQYERKEGAPIYITIGDGGNHEGLATGWVEPQPEWSAFRQASYGFGELRVMNSTHAYWSWHQNGDLVPEVADEVYFVKNTETGYQGLKAVGSESFTGTPVFAQSSRGEKARASNDAAKLASSRTGA
eukprot:CAMPEP_0185025300 /NCGR_PEP_ID=MMETSP1103-20130426/8313_1 /TAXON_ID=36769 /ORGANISM="Paraphysomonas bandaiensis, Strain Caron Lab Isolate" /LENGTH=458 /DNA_ID=CAMNT_0027558471 /DNA_START=43 /DNA_END=1419 /DNA_ORIENTATION=+